MSAVDARPIAQLLRDIVEGMRGLVRSEVSLVKAEITQGADRAGRAAKIGAIGAVLGFFFLAALIVTITWLLSKVLEPWAAMLVMAVLLGIPAYLMVTTGFRKFKAAVTRKEI